MTELRTCQGPVFEIGGDTLQAFVLSIWEVDSFMSLELAVGCVLALS